MKKTYIKLIMLALIAAPLTVFAGDIVKKSSSHSVKETMNKFEKLIKSKGMDVFARIDHQENASGVKMKMNEAEVLIFGNPKGGTGLMQKDPGVSLDLPLRVAVYKDSDGKVWISYHNPQGLKKSHYVATAAKVLDKVEGALNKLTTAASN